MGGGALGYGLGVKNVYTMNVEFYTGVDERLDMPMILPPVPDLVDFADFKVLVADDDDVSRVALQALLVRRGYEVVPARDGAEAWELLRADGRPRLAVLDRGVELDLAVHANFHIPPGPGERVDAEEDAAELHAATDLAKTIVLPRLEKL